MFFGGFGISSSHEIAAHVSPLSISLSILHVSVIVQVYSLRFPVSCNDMLEIDKIAQEKTFSSKRT